MTRNRLAAVLKPSSLVLVGASDRPGTLGDLARRNLAEGGFKGKVHFVNTSHRRIAGQLVLRSVLALPEPVDVAMIVTPAATLPAILEQCARRGVAGAIVVAAAGGQSGGRSGGTPARLERDLRRLAHKLGIRLLGPTSLGLIRTDSGLNAACGPALPLAGRLALVSQSASLCAAVLDWARTRHIGFSTVISTGTAADVDVAEILEFLIRDPATDGVLLCIEEVGDARRFMSALRAAARAKPVVVMKSGRSAESEDASAFHARALIGPDDVFDAALRRAGVLRIRDFSDLLTAAATLGSGVRVRGRRLAIVSNAGGPATLAADHSADRWLQLATLSARTRTQVKILRAPGTPIGNPVLVQADADAAQFSAAVRHCVEDPGVDAVLAILAPHAATAPEATADALSTLVAERRNPPVFTCWMGGDSAALSRQRFAEQRIPSYASPQAAVDAIGALALHAANQQQLLQVPAPLGKASSPDRAAVQHIVDEALAAGQEWLDPAQSKAVLAAFGVPVLQGVPAGSAWEAVAVAERIGYPLVMKIHSTDIPHKSDVGGVRLGLADAAAVAVAYRTMLEEVARQRPDAHLDGVLLEPMLRQRCARELMVGVVRDAVFGPALSVGLGGALVGVIGDRAVALPPLNRFLVQDMLRRSRAGRALRPLRGAPAADERAVEDLLLCVSELVCEVPALADIDLNPVVVTDAGALVVDARIGIRHTAAALPYSHMAIHPYPSGLVQAVELQGGVQATIRPIRPEDASIEAAFVHALSEQSKFLRFMFVVEDLDPATLARFTQIDYDRELALIGVIDTGQGEQQIGVARYATLEDGSTCEFAIVVADEWQGKGLARRLFALLIEAARARELQVMEGVTLRENGRMIELAKAHGFSVRTDPGDTTQVQMRLDLQAEPRSPTPDA